MEFALMTDGMDNHFAVKWNIFTTSSIPPPPYFAHVAQLENQIWLMTQEKKHTEYSSLFEKFEALRRLVCTKSNARHVITF